jgi:tetratricopeptide (TPR) repeat protein
MLETIREFAVELFAESPEKHKLRRRHAQHFADQAGRMEVEHSTVQGAELGRLWHRLRADYDNLRAAFGWAIQHREREVALQLVGVGPLAYAGTVPDGRRLVEQALALDGASSIRAEAATLQRGGQLAFEAGDMDASMNMLQRSTARFQELGDVGSTLDSLTDLAQSEAAHGHLEHARAHLDQAIERSRETSLMDRLAAALHALGELERDHGRYARSAELLEEALELWERDGHLRHAGETRHGLADLRLEQGMTDEAFRLYRTTLLHFRHEDNKRAIAYSLGGLAAASAATGQVERAGRLWGAVEALEAQRGAPLAAFTRARYSRSLATLETEALERDIALGRKASLQEMIELALSEEPPGSTDDPR